MSILTGSEPVRREALVQLLLLVLGLSVGHQVLDLPHARLDVRLRSATSQN